MNIFSLIFNGKFKHIYFIYGLFFLWRNSAVIISAVQDNEINSLSKRKLIVAIFLFRFVAFNHPLKYFWHGETNTKKNRMIFPEIQGAYLGAKPCIKNVKYHWIFRLPKKTGRCGNFASGVALQHNINAFRWCSYYSNFCRQILITRE